MKKVLKKRAGFTLVELLIVIIIIGILAGAMLLVAGSGTDKAEATKIVSNLRSLKAASLLYYADYPTSSTVPNIASLEPYMDRKVTEQGAYVSVAGTVVSSDWYVGRTDVKTVGVQNKLVPMAKSTGLYSDVGSTDYTGGEKVYMKAR